MQPPEKNKQMSASSTKESRLEEYFFPGGMEYVPITIRASSRVEAEQKWKEERVRVGEDEK